MPIVLSARRAFAAFKVRSLEIQLQGMHDVMQMPIDEETRITVSLARQQVRHDLTAARANYIQLLPPGQRRTWSTA